MIDRRRHFPLLIVALLGLLPVAARAAGPWSAAQGGSCAGPVSCCCEAPGGSTEALLESPACPCVETVPAPAPGERVTLAGPELSLERYGPEAWAARAGGPASEGLRPASADGLRRRGSRPPPVRDRLGVRLI